MGRDQEWLQRRNGDWQQGCQGYPKKGGCPVCCQLARVNPLASVKIPLRVLLDKRDILGIIEVFCPVPPGRLEELDVEPAELNRNGADTAPHHPVGICWRPALGHSPPLARKRQIGMGVRCTEGCIAPAIIVQKTDTDGFRFSEKIDDGSP